jgi:glycosyltransferase involved in cell wall biosynthesis
LNNEIFFSIIIPTKNRKDLLIQAIESALDQSYQDFEILVVNDHGYSINDLVGDKIRILDNDGHGRSAARNTGIKNAKAKYITFLDDDDKYHKEYLNTFYESILKNGSDKIYRQNFQKYPGYVKGGTSISYDIQKHKNPFNYVLNNMCSISIACPRELLLNEKFDERFELWEDTHLMLRLLVSTEFVQIDKAYYFYRIHQEMGSQKLIKEASSLMSLCDANIEPMKDILLKEEVMNYINKEDILKVIAKKYLHYGMHSNDKINFLKSSLNHGFHLSLLKDYLYLFIK